MDIIFWIFQYSISFSLFFFSFINRIYTWKEQQSSWECLREYYLADFITLIIIAARASSYFSSGPGLLIFHFTWIVYDFTWFWVLLQSVKCSSRSSHPATNNWKSLGPSEIKKSYVMVENIMEELENTFLSPFHDELDAAKLYNVASGQPADDFIKEKPFVVCRSW